LLAAASSNYLQVTNKNYKLSKGVFARDFKTKEA